MIQIFGGGRHAGNRIDIQDFLILCIGAKTFAEACEWTAEVYFAAQQGHARPRKAQRHRRRGRRLARLHRQRGRPRTADRRHRDAGFTPGRDIGICLDVAASSFFANGAYTLALEGRELANGGMIEMLERWCETYPIISLEDPLAEDDDAGFAAITQRLGGKHPAHRRRLPRDQRRAHRSRPPASAPATQRSSSPTSAAPSPS